MPTSAVIYTRAAVGVSSESVIVEACLSPGLPSFHIVGLPEATVRESRERVRSAILTSQFKFPAGRLVINLAPADFPKQGSRFDLPIAISILAATGQIPCERLSQMEFIGELSLSGTLRPVTAALPSAIGVMNVKRELILPEGNAAEASLSRFKKIFPADSLLQICKHLQNISPIRSFSQVEDKHVPPVWDCDLGEVQGQAIARRALEIAAAGGHNLLFIGPPGTGKTMLATRFPTILPALPQKNAMEVACVLSVSGKKISDQNWLRPPFRSPHHTCSATAMAGGGNPPRPGEVSLAHCGVLFLDELPEFKRHVLEVLREPMESGHIVISRAGHQRHFPASFQLLTAMNPCPCGYAGDLQIACRCTSDRIANYRSRISGPLLDRIDIQVELSRNDGFSYDNPQQAESSNTVRKRVLLARGMQKQRGTLNARLNSSQIKKHCDVDEVCKSSLSKATKSMGLSLRAHQRVLRVARTIADLDEKEEIKTAHLNEAISYRILQ